MLASFYTFVIVVIYLELANSFPRNLRSYTPVIQEIFEVEQEPIEVDCGTNLGYTDINNILGNPPYKLKANAFSDDGFCDLRIPTNLMITLKPSLNNPESYVRILAGNQMGYNIASPKIFAHNATNALQPDHSNTWFIPCSKATLILYANNPQNSVTFYFTKASETMILENGSPSECNGSE